MAQVGYSLVKVIFFKVTKYYRMDKYSYVFPSHTKYVASDVNKMTRNFVLHVHRRTKDGHPRYCHNIKLFFVRKIFINIYILATETIQYKQCTYSGNYAVI
jgi:hypothetical protein